jgi:hypothetical protein
MPGTSSIGCGTGAGPRMVAHVDGAEKADPIAPGSVPGYVAGTVSGCGIHFASHSS